MTLPSDPQDDSADSATEDDAAADVQSAPKGVELSIDQLSTEALRGLVEEYITREGTDYGYSTADQDGAADPHAEWSLEEKVAQVYRQLESGDARIVFDLEQETASIVPAEALAAHVGQAEGTRSDYC